MLVPFAWAAYGPDLSQPDRRNRRVRRQIGFENAGPVPHHRRLQDRVWTTAPLATRPLIDMWVNEGYEDILLQTHCRVRGCTMALTSGTNDYTMDTDIMAVMKIYNTSASGSFFLERLTLGDLLDMRQAGGTATTAPARYYATSGSNLLTVYPTPGTRREPDGLLRAPPDSPQRHRRRAF